MKNGMFVQMWSYEKVQGSQNLIEMVLTPKIFVRVWSYEKVQGLQDPI